MLLAALKRNVTLYTLLLALVILLNMTATVLRSARSALAVADVGGTAVLVPYYELLGTMPAALFFSWLLARLLRHFSLPRVFLLTLSGFLLFFSLYAAAIYPLWRHYAPAALAIGGLWSLLIAHVPILLFFAIAEMWKVALLSILLWGYINQCTAMEKAKVLYAPLMVGTSIGTMLAQPFTSTCSKNPLFTAITVDQWHAVLSTQLVAVIAVGFAIAFLFLRLARHLGTPALPPSLGLKDAVIHTWRSPYLYALAVIVIVDYLVYSLIEVLFLAKVKECYPNPTHYCEVMAQLALGVGLLTAVTSLLVGPQLLRRLPWTVSALVSPAVVAPAAACFLGVVIAQEWGWLNPIDGLEYALWSGALFYCLGRATKYALVDSTKELAFIPLPRQEQLQGKLAIEALASRGGRGLASILSIALFGIAGGVAGSAPAVLLITLAGVGFWIRATLVVGSSPALQRSLPSESPLTTLTAKRS